MGVSMSLRDWLEGHHVSWRSVGLGLLVALVGYVVVQPSQDNVAHFFRQIYRDAAENVVGLETQPGVPQYTRDLSVHNLKQMLASTSPALRASAVRAIGDRSIQDLFPVLIKLLNDLDPLPTSEGAQGTSLASLSKQSLTRIARDRIKREPANVGLLSPLFSAALQGTPLERSAVIQIIGSTGEPLAIPLLSRIRDQQSDRDIKEVAGRALDHITSDKVETPAHTKLKANQIQVVLAMSAMAVILLGSGANSLRKGMEARFVLFPLVPILLCGWLACMVAMEFQRGRADFQAVAAAIAEANPSALRSLNYQDPAEFPGDSYIAQYLVAIGNADVIRCVALLDLPDPDDLESWKARVNTRNKWVLARILASNLNAATLEEWIQNQQSQGSAVRCQEPRRAYGSR